MGIFYIATGHYVRKVKVDDTCYITYAADSDKDQTFFLWGLKQDILRRMLLPMGDITKVEEKQSGKPVESEFLLDNVEALAAGEFGRDICLGSGNVTCSTGEKVECVIRPFGLD